ncbi:hypothetical protein J4N02_10945 [Propioniciclava sp. MC1595]|nr:low molecular weight phosphatase family protein [Propioniciclava sp. MC1595]MBB1502591.1 low molecular weight phosphatase family protein [Propioniciclava sp. MC1683]QTE25066.1 hypothetical protein J4N02_10945 [Propioniciclava sp. MC1595]
MTTDRRPTVLFVCVSNAGKSQMAEALLRRRVGDAVAIHSAGTRPKPVEAGVNAESAASVAEVGASMADATPKGIDPELLRTADRVVILGADAQVEPVEGMKATIERWETDEPSLRGIEGTARMNIIRDDIDARVGALASELGVEQRPSVMFVCVHNAGRSQMAAAYAHHLSGGVVEVRSAGSAPAETINPAVREALLEEGIDISAEKPKVLTDQAVRASDVVITMGCGDTCPFYPGKRYEDWVLEDPAGQGVDAVRPIRDDIKRRVTELLASLDVPVQPLPGDR